jgi:outer membrane scaffolding protein for murein synthesis (MipA/OmpV family)
MGWFSLSLGTRKRAAFGIVAVLFLFVRPTHAQTPSPLAEWQYSSGIQLQRLFEPTIPTWEVELGLGTQFGPVSTGLARYKVQGGPAIDIRYKDIAFASTGEGIGANLFSFRHISVGAAITYDMGRSQHADGKILTGMGDIHFTPEFKIFATTVVSESFPLTIRVDVRKQLGASWGYVGDIGAYMPMPGSSAKFAWFLGPTVTVADGRYAQTYFGVSHAQASSTNYKYFKAHAGFESAGIGLSTNYFVTQHVIISVDAAYDRLLAAAAKSPVTDTKNEAVVSLAATYKF